MRSPHTPLRRPVHGGDFPSHTQHVLLLYVTDDSPNQEILFWLCDRCNEIHNLEIAFHTIRERLLNNLHQRSYCARPMRGVLVWYRTLPLFLIFAEAEQGALRCQNHEMMIDHGRGGGNLLAGVVFP